MDDPVRIRASSLWDLFDCPLRWESKHINGLNMPSSAPAAIGTAVHASTAVFDQARVQGDFVSTDDAAAAAVDAIKHPHDEVRWGDTSPRKAEEIALRCHTSYCNRIGSQRTYHAVEAALKPLVIDVDGVQIELTGTLDRIRVVDEKAGVCDVKTGGASVDTSGNAKTGKHGPQLGVYTLLGETTFTELDFELPPEIIGLQTTKNPRVGLGVIPEAREQLVGTEDVPGFLDFAAGYLTSGLFPPNPSSQLCSERYCPAWRGCPYKG